MCREPSHTQGREGLGTEGNPSTGRRDWDSSPGRPAGTDGDWGLESPSRGRDRDLSTIYKCRAGNGYKITVLDVDVIVVAIAHSSRGCAELAVTRPWMALLLA